MVAAFVVAALAATVDTRTILGINPWIKPMKFMASIAIFLWTMAWFMAEADPRHAGRLRAVRWTMLGTMIGEVALISMQAARGTTSHFNVATVFDGAVFQAMGIMIVANTIAAAVFVTTLHPITTARAGYLWGIRLGLALFVLGSLQGFMMVARLGHSVPGPDGGPGLPFLNWSTTGGDLRSAHFVGLHALQALPLVGFALDRLGGSWRPQTRRGAVTATAVVWVTAAAGALLLALAGRPLMGWP